MAIDTGVFTTAGGAVQDLYASRGRATTAAGQRLEAQQYDLAAGLARQNEEFTKQSTAIKVSQENRNIIKTMGGQQAEVASSGFEQSGSALDILRDSASQGALTKNVLSQQGLITEAGYEEQAKSYNLMAQASRMSADASDDAARGSMWSSIIKWGAVAASAVATVYTGGAASPLLAASLGSALSDGAATGSPAGLPEQA